MMKFTFLLIFMIPLCFMKNMFWMVQMMLFFMMFMFMNLNLNINGFSNISYMFSYDVMSYGLILLSIWICILMVMSGENLYKMNFYCNFFLFNVIILLLLLYLTFSSMNLFLFYLFFEGSLIPTLMLIIGWGYQPERIQAGMYLLFYTLFASLFSEVNCIMIYFLKIFNMDYYLFLKSYLSGGLFTKFNQL